MCKTGEMIMNIYDVAKEAGVSITTVSRMINNKGYVSEKTRKKIQDVLDGMNTIRARSQEGW